MHIRLRLKCCQIREKNHFVIFIYAVFHDVDFIKHIKICIDARIRKINCQAVVQTVQLVHLT